MGQEGGEEAVKKHLVEFENYLKQNHTYIGGKTLVNLSICMLNCVYLVLPYAASP